MRWIELKVVTSHEAAEVVSEFLLEFGAGGVEIYDPHDADIIRNDPGKQIHCDGSVFPDMGNTVLKAYFPEGADSDKVNDILQGKLREASAYLYMGPATIESSFVDDEDWANSWKKYYKPFNITDKIIIKPSWEELDKGDGDGVVVEIDPGMAFGTGTHETTAMCAGLIEEYLKPGDEVIDLGCGSGILSVIAVKLGAGSVQAVDVDSIAVQVSRENACRNRVDRKIRFIVGTITDVAPVKMDIIVANITSDVIIDISEKLKYYLRPGGIFIASGVIRPRAEEVLDTYKRHGFALVKSIQKGEWMGMAFRWQGSLLRE